MAKQEGFIILTQDDDFTEMSLFLSSTHPLI